MIEKSLRENKYISISHNDCESASLIRVDAGLRVFYCDSWVWRRVVSLVVMSSLAVWS